MKREERVAQNIRGTLIRSDETFFFRRQQIGDDDFEDYDINVEDLDVVLVDPTVSLFRTSEDDIEGVIDEATPELLEVLDINDPERSGLELLVELSVQDEHWIVYSPSVSVNDIGPSTQDPCEALIAWIKKEVGDLTYKVSVTKQESETYGIFVNDRGPLEKFLDETCFNRRVAKMDIDALVAEKVMGLPPIRRGVRIPRYSSDMNDAMLVIAALSEMDACCIKLDLDVPGGVWGVKVKGNNYKCETKVFFERPAELPLVICLAALKLMGVNV